MDGMTEADVAYIRRGYRPLEEVCREHGDRVEDVQAAIRDRRLPAPSYVLPDGSEMVPNDYFALVDDAGGIHRLREEFDRRHRAAGGAANDLEEDWQGYLDGLYAVCLRRVTPETIVRKTELVRSIGELLESEAPDEGELRRQVVELDELEREFSPDYDRRRFPRPPTRDLLIVAAQERFPHVFRAEVGSHGR